MGDWVWRDGQWLHAPDLATPVTAADYDPSATRVDIPAIGGRVTYGDAVDYAPVPPGLPERIDGWCEDRPVDELTDEDGRD